MRTAGIPVGLIGHIPGWAEAGLPIFGRAGLTNKWGAESPLLSLLKWPLQCIAVARIARKHRGATFHVQFKREQLGLSKVLRRYGNVVWTEHGRFRRSWRSRILGKLYRRTSRYADSIIAVSSAVASDVKSVGVSGRVEVIPNTVDVSRYAAPASGEVKAAKKRFNIAESEVSALWIGRVETGKRPDLAIEAAVEADIDLLFVGAGDQLETLAKGIYAPKRVIFAGHLADPTVAYRACEILIFTSAGTGEGLPLALLEGAACGLILVTHPSSGMAEPVVQLDGVLASGDSPQAIAEAVRKAAKLASQEPRIARALTSRSDWVSRHRMALKVAEDD
ncbi:glycosyltransferase [Amnibacterium setariae]|uniref:Glycosyltransferase n=2 Tax=Amnibacterium setariae TaxID=2306585 RepID=A0A3A1TYY5_9MICO|nr:glycosyltransferase [Amnibacterium setariae]